LEWFFDEFTADNFQDVPKRLAAPSRADWDWKLAGVARAIAEMRPTIIALQEVENRRVLFYLTSRLKRDHGLDYNVAYIEGDDYFTEQDVAVLAQTGLTGFSFKRQTDEMFETGRYFNITKHLFCNFEWEVSGRKIELLLLTVHFRAQPDAADIRKRQSRLARYWIDERVRAGGNVIVLGDINTEETFETTTVGGDIGTLRGLDTPATNDDLIDLFQFYPGPSKETHLVHKQFDHILVSRCLGTTSPPAPGFAFKSIAIRKDLVVRGKGQDQNHQDDYWKIPPAERDISDHYPVVAEFELKP
jgi:endonuclease/exonuclease/phosphatase family metal-dependent hydrolase